jgi:hypothetical protein
MLSLPEIKLRNLSPSKIDGNDDFSCFVWQWSTGEFEDINKELYIYKTKRSKYNVAIDVDDPDKPPVTVGLRKFYKYEDALKYLRQLGRKIDKKTFVHNNRPEYIPFCAENVTLIETDSDREWQWETDDCIYRFNEKWKKPRCWKLVKE